MLESNPSVRLHAWEALQVKKTLAGFLHYPFLRMSKRKIHLLIMENQKNTHVLPIQHSFFMDEEVRKVEFLCEYGTNNHKIGRMIATTTIRTFSRENAIEIFKSEPPSNWNGNLLNVTRIKNH